MTQSTLIAALASLRPGAQYSLHGESIEWLDAGQAQPDAATLAAEIQRLDVVRMARDIDDAVAAIYTKVGRFAEEYKLRESQALAFQAAGFAGDVPRQIAAYATPAGITPAQATTVIMAQATQLRGALDALGELRMQKIALASVSHEEAAATYADVMASITAIGSSL